MNIAIYGAGSLGTIMGAYLSAADHTVDLIDTFEEHVDILNKCGATITGTTDFHISVNAIKPEEINKTYDLILLLTKQTYNNDVLPLIKNILNKDSVLLSLQNGVPEEVIQQYIPRENIVAGSVEFGATFKGPGISELTTDYDTFKNYALQIGELNGEITNRLRELKGVLDSIGNVHLSDNLMGTKWSKLLINSAFSGLSAALNCTYGAILDNQDAFTSAMHVVDECIKAGHANNVQFANMGSLSMSVFENLNHSDKLKGFMQSSRRLEASMLQDLRKNRKTEIDYINGLVVSVGSKHNISTPFNQIIVDIVSNASKSGKLPNFDNNLQKLKEIL
ncbi:ketopantoate reductase family protein [Staphylococcus succinus]|uniref:ketopantoate reductase family protein n=1 Tax=Staphylococcus succinus TaxID=61015 RepID=UPI000AF634BC|nr:ketopantoate reductase family protein [Staphylococcus succinus]MBU0439347.1 ketopantoate reductase family protein [Staphylococcus succinus]